MSGARWCPAYIGIGSNLDDPVQQVERAFVELDALPDTWLVLGSSLYRSAPLGDVAQPDFVNAVAAVVTTLSPEKLLGNLQTLEDAAGRNREVPRWGPRTLDLDLLSYATEMLDSPDLKLPHPGIAERNFVLLPWNEIAPHVHVPGLGRIANLVTRAPAAPTITRISET